MPVAEDVVLGRAKNACLTFLGNRLYVPKIYLDATWSGEKVDLLAIDRDGVGDVHVALLFSESYLAGAVNRVHKAEREWSLLERFKGISAQYKWLCRVRTERQELDRQWSWPDDFLDATFAPDGIGRVGVLLVDLTREEDNRPVVVELKPERFRAFVGKMADEYVEKHTADWEIRA